MIRRRDNDYMGRKAVDFQKKSGDDTLDLSSFMLVCPLFPDGVELVEEEQTPSSASVGKDAIQAQRRFAQET